jgi:hypothetical protein
MRKTVTLFFIVAAAMLVLSGVSFAQDNDSDAQYDQYLTLLRKDLRSGKKQFLAANMQLTETEATKFWPVYDKYAGELEKLNDERVALIKDYADNFQDLTDKTAAGLNERSIKLDRAFADLRLKYVPMIAKVLPGKKAALFFQLDKRLGLLIDLQLASEIPLVTP